ncbi:MAG TPA: AAA family ATPase, partial [Candidatus Caenarcaniphilales bacterium]
MTITLTDYNLTQTIYEGDNTLIYRASREVEPTSILVKTLKNNYPSLEEITQLRNEYNLLQTLETAEIVKPISLESYQNSLALILPDFEGESLRKLLAAQKLDLNQFLQLAIQITSIVAALHQNNILHKDIKPDHFLANAATRQVRIIDLSTASRLPREEQTTNHHNLLVGTLAYMSPEQTGRMNRSIDYRTDFYSLGITFYEMLTGQLPFQTDDPLELIHCHIAKTPVLPKALNPDVPQALSNVVMKLLAKTAEERYQSALGLKADLEALLRMLQKRGKISHFSVGQLDLYSQFLISQKLYGREKEVVILMNAFENVSLGATEMMLVSGYSGVGKSSLVNEVHKPILRRHGYFISGKFDQFKRNIPYSSLVQAFQELLLQLLAESADKVAVWRSKLMKALGPNGQVIIDFVPELEQIIGPQPAVLQIGPSESQTRFHRVFQQFIHVLSQPEHPLVVFLDDLQWADLSSLKLIEKIVSDPDSQYLLLIGAYRDNEVSTTHPLIRTLEEIQKARGTVNNIVLQPLNSVHVNQLVADTLRTPPTKAKPLADLVFKKTQGNPFFLTQLLKSLHQDNLLTFNFGQGCWEWNIDVLQGIDITENVVELMVSQIQKLSQKTQDVLKLAACVGSEFTLDILAIINEKSQLETAKDLWESLQAGLILPLSEAYKIPLGLGLESSVTLQAKPLKVSYKFL